MTKIKGGYYLKARCIQESEISHAPPYVREIWDWLIKEANHCDTKICKRGQTIRTFKDIQEGLCWYAGWRKHTYSKDQCEKAMKWLRKATMIATEKTTRGLLITVLNYDKFQTSSNYETDNESNRKATVQQQYADTINKNDKNYKNEKNIYITLTEQIEPLRSSYPPSMIEKFMTYWDETNTKGIPRWKMEKTWDIKLRLKKWKAQDEEWAYERQSKKFKPEEQPVRESQPVRIDEGLTKVEEEYFKKYGAYPLR